VIFLFHLVLSGNWIWGTLNLVWSAGLAWRYREELSPHFGSTPKPSFKARGFARSSLQRRKAR
jgi:hypothetical protein